MLMLLMTMMLMLMLNRHCWSRWEESVPATPGSLHVSRSPSFKYFSSGNFSSGTFSSGNWQHPFFLLSKIKTCTALLHCFYSLPDILAFTYLLEISLNASLQVSKGGLPICPDLSHIHTRCKSLKRMLTIDNPLIKGVSDGWNWKQRMIDHKNSTQWQHSFVVLT